ncbi:Uncharacterised protein [Bordetella pertussis]|nr:Uncharacterised protein [Bordetella pertussis]
MPPSRRKRLTWSPSTRSEANCGPLQGTTSSTWASGWPV